MSEPTITEEERQVVRILAFAAREFDRVHDILVRDDEPGEHEVATENAEIISQDVSGRSDSDESSHAAHPDEDAGQEKQSSSPGMARRLLGVATGVVSGVAHTAGRLVTGTVHPRHPGWDEADVEERIDWWVDRFGTAAAALAAVPGLGGKIGRLTSIGDVVGASAQILTVNAVAREMGITDISSRVAAAGRIVLGHELNAAAVTQELNAPEAQPEQDIPGDAPEERKGPIARVGRSAALVWRVAGRIRNLRSDLDERPQGGFLARALSNLPAVGALGAFVSERKGIHIAAKQARAAFTG
ncbi:hypothetical protein [Gephyromycinifex aptenodytis]|uniref:hypothetical protein n=1 Tax=Gephyromycinifex aptenodytis TaxID=2716227 RepID=UPI001448854E|nr:hypothetical protein [Gephyromycinifex aptenodytis]